MASQFPNAPTTLSEKLGMLLYAGKFVGPVAVGGTVAAGAVGIMPPLTVPMSIILLLLGVTFAAGYGVRATGEHNRAAIAQLHAGTDTEHAGTETGASAQGGER